MKRFTFLAALLSAVMLSPAESVAQTDEIDMDDVKIKLVAKGELSVKKIIGPDKALLQQILRLRLAQELSSAQKSPELLQPENLEIIELNDTLFSNSPSGIDIPAPNDLSELPQLPVLDEMATQIKP